MALAALAVMALSPQVERSNRNAQLPLQLVARFAPESAGELGVAGLDDAVLDLQPGHVERLRAEGLAARAELARRLTEEKDAFVRQDLEILIDAVDLQIEEGRLSEQYDLPYFDIALTVFRGIRALLDDQVAPERRTSALARLRRYAGQVEGAVPIAQLAADRIREKLAVRSLAGPFRDELLKNLENSKAYADGIGQLFTRYAIAGHEEPLALLRAQLAGYDEFLRREVLPRARQDFRLPPERYAHQLRRFGVDLPVEELQSRARVAFREIQNEMAVLAPLVAREKGLPVGEPRAVLRALKARKLEGEAILPHYQARIRDLEKIVREQRIVTLPTRPMRMRIASEAESAALPAPNMRPPRLLGNTGEMGEFVLPLKIPGRAGQGQLEMDDFSFEAASWTLSAHEGRPGHELQFAAMVEQGISFARAIFAFNSVNVEGWALYAEAEMKPFEPLDGQLVALQHRLIRAARAILDPGLQLGTITREQALRVLREDVGLSEAMALQEIERYTFLHPGQATSYFAGYQRLMELRADVERLLGERFDKQSYHDFILAQGLLPPRLLRKAVLEEYVRPRQ